MSDFFLGDTSLSTRFLSPRPTPQNAAQRKAKKVPTRKRRPRPPPHHRAAQDKGVSGRARLVMAGRQATGMGLEKKSGTSPRLRPSRWKTRACMRWEREGADWLDRITQQYISGIYFVGLFGVRIVVRCCWHRWVQTFCPMLGLASTWLSTYALFALMRGLAEIDKLLLLVVSVYVHIRGFGSVVAPFYYLKCSHSGEEIVP